MIDQHGFRANVGIILVNDKNQLFWAKRVKQHAWQFPQGGLNEQEDIIDCMYRELYEEIGLKKDDVTLLAQTKNWLRYKLPHKLLRTDRPPCIGQKQKWFLLKLTSSSAKIDLKISKKPEFDDWRWVSYWYPLRYVVSFKREVYRKALRELAPTLFGISTYTGRTKPLQFITE